MLSHSSSGGGGSGVRVEVGGAEVAAGGATVAVGGAEVAVWVRLALGATTLAARVADGSGEAEAVVTEGLALEASVAIGVSVHVGTDIPPWPIRASSWYSPASLPARLSTSTRARVSPNPRCRRSPPAHPASG